MSCLTHVISFRVAINGKPTTVYSPGFQDGLDGLDGFSHIFVLSHLDRLKPEQIGVLKVRPRRLVGKGFKLDELPLVGVFALDSPTRPNPIALSLVRLSEPSQPSRSSPRTNISQTIAYQVPSEINRNVHHHKSTAFITSLESVAHEKF